MPSYNEKSPLMGPEGKLKNSTKRQGRNLLFAVFSATIGSFLYGYLLSGLNTLSSAVATDLFPCTTQQVEEFMLHDSGQVACWAYARNVSSDLTPCYDQECVVSAMDHKEHNAEGPSPKLTSNKQVCHPPTPVSCRLTSLKTGTLQCSALFGAATAVPTAPFFLSFGRRKLLMFAFLFLIPSAIFCSLATGFWAIVAFRYLSGGCAGAMMVVVPTYISEICPPNVRGAYGVIHQLMLTVGILVGISVGLPLKDCRFNELVLDTTKMAIATATYATSHWNTVLWRVMAAVLSIPAFLAMLIFLFYFKSETPAYYVEKSLNTNARNVLMQFNEAEDVDVALQGIVAQVIESTDRKKHGLSLCTAFMSPVYRHVIMIGLFLSAFQQLSGVNVFVGSSNKLFGQAGLPQNMATIASIVMAIMNTCCTLPSIYLIEKLGRRTLLLLGTLGQTVAVLPATVMLWVDPSSKATMYSAIVGAIAFMISFSMAYGPVLWVYLFEMFPLEIKESGSGLATLSNLVFGILMLFVGNILPELRVSYTIFTVLNAVAFLFVLRYIRETAGLSLGQSPYFTTSAKKNVWLPRNASKV